MLASTSSTATTSRLASAAPADSEQIQTGRVPVEDLEAEPSQQLDLVGVVVEDGGAYARREQHPPDDLPEAAEPRDDHPRSFGLDGVGRPRRLASARAASRSVASSASGVRAMDSATTRVKVASHWPGSSRACPRGAEHHEGELAPLRQQRGEHHRCPCGHPQRLPGDAQSSAAFRTVKPSDQADDRSGRCATRPKSTDMPDGDEEEAHQQALERLDVGLQRVPVLGSGEQHAGEEGAQRHRERRPPS